MTLCKTDMTIECHNFIHLKYVFCDSGSNDLLAAGRPAAWTAVYVRESMLSSSG